MRRTIARPRGGDGTRHRWEWKGSAECVVSYGMVSWQVVREVAKHGLGSSEGDPVSKE